MLLNCSKQTFSNKTNTSILQHKQFVRLVHCCSSYKNDYNNNSIASHNNCYHITQQHFLKAITISQPIFYRTTYRTMSSSTASNIQSKPTVNNPITDHGLLSGVTRIGWIGTGVMGSSMVQHVMHSMQNENKTSKLLPTYIYTRTPSKAQAVVDAGATLCNSVAEVAQNSDIVFTMLGFPTDVQQVYYGDSENGGILDNLGSSGIVVDMTTSEPTMAKQIATDAKQRNIYSLDAPVSGGDIGAREGKLSIMIGGEQQIMYAVLPLFQAMGKNITYCGTHGHGQHTKMMNQILIANNMIGMCEGILYAYKAGLDISTAISAVSAGAAGSWSINNLAPRIVRRDFEPGFYIDHFVKDMGICLQESARMKIALPGLALARQLYIALQAQGEGQRGTQALILALERLSGLNVPNDKHMYTQILPQEQGQQLTQQTTNNTNTTTKKA